MVTVAVLLIGPEIMLEDADEMLVGGVAMVEVASVLFVAVVTPIALLVVMVTLLLMVLVPVNVPVKTKSDCENQEMKW
jgi:hypothetical protein